MSSQDHTFYQEFSSAEWVVDLTNFAEVAHPIYDRCIMLENSSEQKYSRNKNRQAKLLVREVTIEPMKQGYMTEKYILCWKARLNKLMKKQNIAPEWTKHWKITPSISCDLFR